MRRDRGTKQHRGRNTTRSGYTARELRTESRSRSQPRLPRFVFYGPCYQPNSNGVRIYYLLAEELLRLGFEICIVAHDHALTESRSPARLKPYFHLDGIDFHPGDVRPDDIVVYPDIVSGNPLAARRVVRFFANRPIVLTGQAVVYGPTDFVVSYSTSVDPHAYPLFVLNDDRKLFHPPSAPKESLALVYFGKVPQGPLAPELERFVNSFEQKLLVTRHFPKSRADLGDLLRKAMVLVTIDPLTNLAYEATLCGTPALIANDEFGLTRHAATLPHWGFFSRPEEFERAAAETARAYPVYVQALTANRARIAGFAAACQSHFALLEKRSPESTMLEDLNRRYLSLRAEVDQLRFETAHRKATITGIGNPPPAGAPAPPPPPPPARYIVADSVNTWAKKLGLLHTLTKHALASASGLSLSPQAPPLRHQLADSVNALVKQKPGLHAVLKRRVRG